MAVNEQLTLLTPELVPTLRPCDCPRHATCPRCDPDYEEQDGDRAAGVVTAGSVPYGVIPF
jgi:hypothetical protein